MSMLREHIDVIEMGLLPHDTKVRIAEMIVSKNRKALVEYCQLHEIDLSKVKKWAKTGALAAALIGSGITAAHAGQNDEWLRARQQRAQATGIAQTQQDQQWQQRYQQRGQDQGQFQQGRQDQRRYQQRGNDEQPRMGQRYQQRGSFGFADDGEDVSDMQRYRYMVQHPQMARQMAQQQGGWVPHPDWVEMNPWSTVDHEPPPDDGLYFDYENSDIVFLAHPDPDELRTAQQLSPEIMHLTTPYWPEQIAAFVYKQDDVVFVVPVPGQLR